MYKWDIYDELGSADLRRENFVPLNISKFLKDISVYVDK